VGRPSWMTQFAEHRPDTETVAFAAADHSLRSAADIPARLNVLIAITASSAAVILLWAASHCETWIAILPCAIAFSFVANTVFSCLHECVHGMFHPDRRINYLFGVVSAAFFPTGFSLQRAAHLSHHRHNRSTSESFDCIHPGDVPALKIVQWYGIISGIYWAVAVLGWIVYLSMPFLFRRSQLAGIWSDVAEHTSGPAYARAFASAPPVKSRLELLLTVALQVFLFRALDLSVTGWLACYAAFAVQWSALQYADHAFSPLDIIEGAWDLRVHPWVQALFMNYHLHLAHHRHPTLPWIHLPRHVDGNRDRPAFLAQYARMWLGPRRMPPDSGS
jgi:fatty acid desaturase